MSVLRPHFANAEKTSTELANHLSQKRLALSRRAALEVLAASLRDPSSAGARAVDHLHALGFLGAPALDEETRGGIAEWEKHDWTLALPYYLASRRTAFFDEGDQFRVRQDEALRQYLTASEAIPQPRAAGPRATPLAPPCDLPDEELGKVLFRRTSSKRFPDRTIPQEQLSAVLSHGFKAIRSYRRPDPQNAREVLRSSGSALDVFFAAYKVEGLTPGIYFYDLSSHTIELVRTGDFRQTVQHCLIGQDSTLTSSCTIFLTTEFRRYQWRYRHERALRNLYMDTAWVINRLILVATSLRLQTFITPATRDTETCDLLGINRNDEQVLYTLTIG
ncbi:MAG TPA: SagB/ThcOx family dehydrogenase [Symbiobacteriaceae bacterium]|nr:SagB/ThcOx family dehydrogenase [Symbiobacteriaceae bacterium]